MLVCCGAPMQEEKRERLVTRLSKIKARFDACSTTALSRCTCGPAVLETVNAPLIQGLTS